MCEIDEHGDAVCNCIKECPYETDSRRKVCTNHNETWTSDCEVYQQRCLCLDGSELCRGPQYHHVQIEYYGTCREMPVSIPIIFTTLYVFSSCDATERHTYDPSYKGSALRFKYYIGLRH